MEDVGVAIISEYGHYTVYIDGKFFCTADTYYEAVRELESEGIMV